MQRVKAGLNTAAAELAWQLASQVWLVTGHASWLDFKDSVYGRGQAVALVRREEGPVFVVELLMAGSTQTEAAETLGVSVGTVNKAAHIFRNENPDKAAVIEAKPHARSGRPKTHAKKPKPTAPAEEKTQPTGEPHDDKVELVQNRIRAVQGNFQSLVNGLGFLPALSETQREVLLTSLEPLEDALTKMRTKLSR